MCYITSTILLQAGEAQMATARRMENWRSKREMMRLEMEQSLRGDLTSQQVLIAYSLYITLTL
jgi:hypothetical protein